MTAPATMPPEVGDYPSYDYQLVSVIDSNEVAVEGITLCHEGFEIR